jgi:hypothetical protein
MINAQRFRWLLLLLCGLGPALFGSILVNQMKSSQLQRHGTVTTARIISDEEGRSGHILNISYFAGRQVQQSMLILTEDEYGRLGDQKRVPVVYDPDNLRIVELKGKQPRGLAVLYAGLVLTLAGVSGLVVSAKAGRSSKSNH